MSRSDHARPYRLGALLAALALVVGAAACSTSESGSGSPDTTVGTDTTVAGPDTTEPEALSLADVEELAQAALLTPTEVGTGFVAASHEMTDPPGPAPCGTPRADSVAPPDVEVGATAESADGNLAFVEEIRYFESPSQAEESFMAGVSGLDCSQGEVVGSGGQSTAVNISPRIDLSSDLPDADRAFAWSVNSADFESQAVAILLGQLVVTMQFANSLGADLSAAPDPLNVVQDALQKILES